MPVLLSLGTSVEEAYRECHQLSLPQYTYVILPIYRTLAYKTGDVAATALTFIASDLIFHSLLPRVLYLSFRSYGSSSNHQDEADTKNTSFDVALKVAYYTLAILVVYTKYQRKTRKSIS